MEDVLPLPQDSFGADARSRSSSYNNHIKESGISTAWAKGRLFTPGAITASNRQLPLPSLSILVISYTLRKGFFLSAADERIIG